MAISNVIPAKPPIEPDIIVPHYVSGRKLTAEDLQTERNISLKRLEFIGRAAGVGIVEGLWVEASGTLGLTITGGLGINEQGHPIYLKNLATINLAPTPTDTTNTAKPQIKFASCNSPSTTNTTGLKDGPYLLTVTPVYNLSNDFVQVQKILPRGTQDDCTNKSEEENVNFRVVFLGDADIPHGFHIVPKPDPGSTIPPDPAYFQRQNLLAHWAFGSEERLSRGSNPFQDWKDLDYSGFGLARSKFEAAGDLTACDLRLAVFFLETDEEGTQSIQFVDNWAVRRRPYHPSQFSLTSTTGTSIPLSGWGQRVNDQLAAEGQARFAQFQEHLDVLRKTSNVGNWSANQYFHYLPPSGYVPLMASDMLRQTIGQFLTDFFLEEVKKYSATANLVGSRLFWTTPSLINLVSVGGNTHTYDSQMNDLIAQINTILGDILSAANALALNQPITPISFEPIQYMRAANPVEIDASTSHVLLLAFNNRIRTAVNTRLTQLANLINQIGTNYGVTVPVPSAIATISGASDNLLHISFSTLNTNYIPLVNTIIAQFVNALNLIAGNPSFAINPFFKKVRDELSGLLKNALAQVLTPTTNGVQLDTFFSHDVFSNSTANNIAQSFANRQSLNDSLGLTGVVISKDVQSSVDVLPAPKVSYMKNIAFTDRQSIEKLLETSYLAPAIDLSTNQNLSLIMVYEDVVPYAAEQLKNIIENSLFTNYRDSLRKIWYAGIRSTFENIIACKSKNDIYSPPLYGLFTQAVYPLQFSTWQQGSVVVVPLPVPDTDQQPGNNDGQNTGDTGGDNIEQPPEGGLN